MPEAARLIEDAMMDTENNPFMNDRFSRISKDAVDILGLPDRMLYRSKSLGKPTTIFNANIYNAEAVKIWYGDLEIERDKDALTELSNRKGPLYILWERDGRFLEQKPTVEYVKERAIVTVNDQKITYSEEFRLIVRGLTQRALNEDKKPASGRVSKPKKRKEKAK
jgi:hypothetical protein